MSPGAQEVAVVAEMAEVAGLASQVRMIHPDQIARDKASRARVHPDPSLRPPRIVAGVLEGLPGDLEEQALLRIHEPRLPLRVTEERRVERVVLLQHRSRLDVVGMALEGGVLSGGPQLLVREEGDRFDPPHEVVPEGPRMGGAREAARHADDGDVPRVGSLGHEPPWGAGAMPR